MSDRPRPSRRLLSRPYRRTYDGWIVAVGPLVPPRAEDEFVTRGARVAYLSRYGRRLRPCARGSDSAKQVQDRRRDIGAA